MQARGLKQYHMVIMEKHTQSRLMQARGLKLYPGLNSAKVGSSRLMQARGLKQRGTRKAKQREKVAPHAGAWIET